MHSAKDIERQYERIIERERLAELDLTNSNRWAYDNEGLYQEPPTHPRYESEKFRDGIETEFLLFREQTYLLEEQLQSQMFSAEVAPRKKEELEELKAQCAQYENVSFLKRGDRSAKRTAPIGEINVLPNGQPANSLQMPLTLRRSSRPRKIDERKKLIADIKANHPEYLASDIAREMDKRIERSPHLQTKLEPLPSWQKLARGLRTWDDLFMETLTKNRVKTYINKIKAPSR